MAELDDARERERFEEWKMEYRKQYKDSDEEEFRFSVFKETLRSVESQIAEDPEFYKWMGMNIWSDLTDDELLANFGGLEESDSDSDSEVKGHDDGFEGEFSSAYGSSGGSTNAVRMPLVPVKRQSVEKATNEDVVKRQKSGCDEQRGCCGRPMEENEEPSSENIKA